MIVVGLAEIFLTGGALVVALFFAPKTFVQGVVVLSRHAKKRLGHEGGTGTTPPRIEGSTLIIIIPRRPISP